MSLNEPLEFLSALRRQLFFYDFGRSSCEVRLVLRECSLNGIVKLCARPIGLFYFCVGFRKSQFKCLHGQESMLTSLL